MPSKFLCAFTKDKDSLGNLIYSLKDGEYQAARDLNGYNEK